MEFGALLYFLLQKKGVPNAPVRARTVGRYSPAPPQGNDGHGPISAARAGLGLVNDSHNVFNLTKRLFFLDQLKGKGIIVGVAGYKKSKNNTE